MLTLTINIETSNYVNCAILIIMKNASCFSG